jgi:hypothetical protein
VGGELRKLRVAAEVKRQSMAKKVFLSEIAHHS